WRGDPVRDARSRGGRKALPHRIGAACRTRTRRGRDRSRAAKAAASLYARIAGGDAARRPASGLAASGASRTGREPVGRSASDRSAACRGAGMNDILVRTSSLSFAYPERASNLFRLAALREVVKHV